jgi:hypothetical protein
VKYVSVTVSPIPVFTLSGNNSSCQGAPISFTANGTATSYSWSSGATGSVVTLFPSSSSVYTIVGTNSIGCKSTQTKSITIIPSPTLSINNGLICLGESYTLSPSGALTYTYSGGTQIVSPTVTSTYTVSGTGANTCVGNATNTVVVYPLPNVSIVADKTEICSGESIFLNGAGAAFYLWSGGQNTSSVNVSPAFTSTYTVTGIANTGCSGDASFVVNVNECLGISEGSANSKRVVVFPNPSRGEFFIESSIQIQLLVTNALGQIILRKEVSEGVNKIDLSIYSSGVYFIRYKTGSLTEIIKLIKTN